jgi:hypothetical protein
MTSLALKYTFLAASSLLLVVAMSGQSKTSFLSSGMRDVASGPAVKIMPPNINFGKQTVGTTATRIVTVFNTGNATLVIYTIDLAGKIESGLTSTTTCPSSLDPGASCTITVNWSVTAGSLSGHYEELTDNASPSTQTVPIVGIGVAED